MADEETPTLPLDLEKILHDIGDDPDTPEDEVEEARKRIPEPALVRGGLFAAANFIAYLAGRQLLDPELIEVITWAYGTVGPVALALWIRSKVTPVSK
jgi:hypothetical protein